MMRGSTMGEVLRGAEASREDLTHERESHARRNSSREDWDGDLPDPPSESLFPESHPPTESTQEDSTGREYPETGGNGTKHPAKIGRPRTVNRLAITNAVCRAISKGDSVKAACKAAGIRPSRLHEWTREDSVLASIYARAREQQAHSLAERAIAVSRRAYGRDTAGVQAARLEVDTLKWYVSKIAPRLYGERLTIEDEGEKVVRVIFEDAVPPGRKAIEAEWELAEE